MARCVFHANSSSRLRASFRFSVESFWLSMYRTDQLEELGAALPVQVEEPARRVRPRRSTAREMAACRVRARLEALLHLLLVDEIGHESGISEPGVALVVAGHALPGVERRQPALAERGDRKLEQVAVDDGHAEPVVRGPQAMGMARAEAVLRVEAVA